MVRARLGETEHREAVDHRRCQLRATTLDQRHGRPHIVEGVEVATLVHRLVREGSAQVGDHCGQSAGDLEHVQLRPEVERFAEQVLDEARRRRGIERCERHGDARRAQRIDRRVDGCAVEHCRDDGHPPRCDLQRHRGVRIEEMGIVDDDDRERRQPVDDRGQTSREVGAHRPVGHDAERHGRGGGTRGDERHAELARHRRCHRTAAATQASRDHDGSAIADLADHASPHLLAPDQHGRGPYRDDLDVCRSSDDVLPRRGSHGRPMRMCSSVGRHDHPLAPPRTRHDRRQPRPHPRRQPRERPNRRRAWRDDRLRGRRRSRRRHPRPPSADAVRIADGPHRIRQPRVEASRSGARPRRSAEHRQEHARTTAPHRSPSTNTLPTCTR